MSAGHFAGLTVEQLQRLLGKTDGLDPAEAKKLLAGLTQEVNKRAAEDGAFWLRFVQTRDEADPEHAVKPFPIHETYVRWLWGILNTQQRVVIAKSRQMMVSWIVCAFCVWWARHKPNQAIYFQTKAWEDAVAMTCMPTGGFQGRCQFIEDHLPSWMRVTYKPAEGRMQYSNGSIIQALSGGADKIRGKTVSIVVEDEFGWQEDQTGVYTALAPVILKGARAIIVSSPNGSDNMFSTLWHGYSTREREGR